MAPAPREPRALPLWANLLAAFTLSRGVIACLGLIGAVTFLDQHTFMTQGPAALHFDVVWRKWDVLWYERIARAGYVIRTSDQHAEALGGFFPLYPLLAGAVWRLAPGLSFFTIGSLLSNAFTLVALALAAFLLADDDLHARRVILLTVTAASSFYLSIPYTEALFLLLVTATIALARRDRFLLAALVSGLGAITRIQGFALPLVPLVAWAIAIRQRPRPRRAWPLDLAALVVAAGLPVVIYMAYLSIAQGTAVAFITRQALWGNAFPYPFETFVGLVRAPWRMSSWVHGSFWMLYALLLARNWRAIRSGEALFCAAAMVISTLQEDFHGIYRYTVPLVPLTLALARERDHVRLTVIAINLIVGTLMILAFVTNNRLAV